MAWTTTSPVPITSFDPRTGMATAMQTTSDSRRTCREELGLHYLLRYSPFNSAAWFPFFPRGIQILWRYSGHETFEASRALCIHLDQLTVPKGWLSVRRPWSSKLAGHSTMLSGQCLRVSGQGTASSFCPGWATGAHSLARNPQRDMTARRASQAAAGFWVRENTRVS